MPETNTKPRHKATYARDNRKGGWMVRIAGEYPEKFAGREVPVTMMDGTKQIETLSKLIWTGTDDKTGEKVALYTFVPKPREESAPPEF